MGYLDDRAVARLRTPPPWKQIDQSLLSKMLEPFWTFATKHTPLWLAPNAITLLGFGMVVVAFALMLVYCPAFDGSPPWFAYAAAVLSVFGFQTLDAIDGKQARRTGSSSPLGNWLDHVCDVIALQLGMLTGACSLRAGASGLTLFVVGSVLFTGYVLHWETKHTGVLFMGNGTSIYEAQVMLMAVHAASWIFGPDVWSRPLGSFVPEALHWLPFAGATLRAWLMVVSVGVMGGIGLVGNFVRVVGGTSGTRPPARARRAHTRGLDALGGQRRVRAGRGACPCAADPGGILPRSPPHRANGPVAPRRSADASSRADPRPTDAQRHLSRRRSCRRRTGPIFRCRYRLGQSRLRARGERSLLRRGHARDVEGARGADPHATGKERLARTHLDAASPTSDSTAPPHGCGI